MLEAAESLATPADRDRLVPELDDSITREIFVRDVRMMYEVASSHVLIVAFVHGARDFETWRREREGR